MDGVRMPRALAAAIVIAAAASAHRVVAQDDTSWRAHDRAASAALARGDLSDARHHLLSMDSLLGGHPGVAVVLARVAARAGDTAEMLAQLRRVAAMGVVSAATGESAFAPYRALPAFRRVERAIRGNAARIGRAAIVATVPDTDAIAEDLGWDPARRRFIVSDVRRHRLRAVNLEGRWANFADPLPPGWAALGVAVDVRRGVVWISGATLPQAEGYVPADSGRAAFLRVALSTGAVQRRFDLPGPSPAAPGDLAIAANHDLYSGDGMTGAVYVIRAATDSLETLVPGGRLHGTQQPVLLPDGHRLLIPDYGRGLATVDLASKQISWLSHPAGVTLTGLDGVVLVGHDLVAAQNGVHPNRIVRLRLDPGMTAVTGATILLRDTTLADEPTHVAIVDGTLFTIGNAGWRKYTDAGAPETGVRHVAPRLLRVRMTAAGSLTRRR